MLRGLHVPPSNFRLMWLLKDSRILLGSCSIRHYLSHFSTVWETRNKTRVSWMLGKGLSSCSFFIGLIIFLSSKKYVKRSFLFQNFQEQRKEKSEIGCHYPEFGSLSTYTFNKYRWEGEFASSGTKDPCLLVRCKITKYICLSSFKLSQISLQHNFIIYEPRSQKSKRSRRKSKLEFQEGSIPLAASSGHSFPFPFSDLRSSFELSPIQKADSPNFNLHYEVTFLDSHCFVQETPYLHWPREVIKDIPPISHLFHTC